MWNVDGGREAANIQKKSVSGYRLKKVMLASIESITALHEIVDTFHDIDDRRKGDYVERLYSRNKVSEEPETQQSEPEKPAEPEQKPPVQDMPKPEAPTPKLPMQDVPKPITPTPKPPVHDTPKPDDPVQKPPEQTKSRGMKRR